MQEDRQMIVYKRGKEIVLRAVLLASVTVICVVSAYFITDFESQKIAQKVAFESALKEYKLKCDVGKMTKQYNEFKEEQERKIAEAEIIKKAATPSAVTYVKETTEENNQVTHKAINPISYEKNIPTEFTAVYEMKATAYCLCKKCCGKDVDDPNYGRTSSGLKIVPGTGMKVIAVDPNVIPLGSKVYVEGLNGAGDYGYAVAADKGSAIKNNKIDLYMDTHEMALKWGRKSVKVYVIE